MFLICMTLLLLPTRSRLLNLHDLQEGFPGLGLHYADKVQHLMTAA